MYALVYKGEATYAGEVKVIAVSEDKQKLMKMLPHEVEKWAREGSRDAIYYPDLFMYRLFRDFLPNGYEPMESWETGAFGHTRFEVQEVPMV